MKWIIVSTFAIFLLSFKSDKPCNKDFKLIEASKQTYFGGAAGSPVITVYRIKLRALRSFRFIPDSAWAEGKTDAIIIDTDSSNHPELKLIKKGDTFEIHFEIRNSSEIGGGDYQIKIPGSPESKAPIEIKNGALIRYKGGKCKYLSINKLIIKETIYAP